MDITLEDVKTLAFELYMAQRENALLRQKVAELERLLAQQDAPGARDG